MDRLQCMEIFRQVAELGSFVRTAEKLELSTAMVSKSVRQLEEHLGARLLHRTSRRVSLTQEGQLYLERLSEVLNELEAAEALLSTAAVKPRGVLRIAAPVWLHQQVFSQGLAAYRERYPEVLLDLQLGDRLVDLIEESVDLALRVTAQPHESLIARRLAPMPFHIVASPAYLDRVGRPKSVSELAQHGMVVNSSIKGWQSLTVYENGVAHQVEVRPVFQTNSTTLAAQAAAAGMGITLLPAALISEAPLKDTLEIILPSSALLQAFSLYAVYTSRRQQSPKVRTFIDFMVEWFRDHPSP